MNSVVKAAVFLGLLTAAVSAQDLGKRRFELRASGGINAGGGPLGSPSPSYDLEAAVGLSRFFALTGDYAHDYRPLRRAASPPLSVSVVRPCPSDPCDIGV